MTTATKHSQPNLMSENLSDSQEDSHHEHEHEHHHHDGCCHTPAVSEKIGRNEPCICGSNKKYKKCCLNKN